MSLHRIFIDGASRGNPGQASIGVSVQNNEKNEIESISQRIGSATNNIAEYSALIAALDLAKKRDWKRIKIFSDSELLVRQMNLQYKVKDPGLRVKWLAAQELLKSFESVSIEHVRREQNRRADELANIALDS